MLSPGHAVVGGKDEQGVVQPAFDRQLVGDLADHAIDPQHLLAVGDHGPAGGIGEERQLLKRFGLVRNVRFVVVGRIPGRHVGAAWITDVLRLRLVRTVHVEDREDGEDRLICRRLLHVHDHAIAHHPGGVDALHLDRALLGLQREVEVIAVVELDRVELRPAGSVLIPLRRGQQVRVVEVLADEERCVACVFHRITDVLGRVELEGVVVDEATVVGVQPRQSAAASRAAQRYLADRVIELEAVVDEVIDEVGGSRGVVPQATVVGWHVVDVEHDDVGRIIGQRGWLAHGRVGAYGSR